MVNFTSNTSQMNREILTFTNKISKHLSKPDKKFSADMTYGILASESCLLTDIVDHLHENTKKVNSVERLTRTALPPQLLNLILLLSVNGLRRNLLYTLMTETLQSLMVTNLRLSDLLSETALKVLLPKQFM